jgi:hypothetical protein
MALTPAQMEKICPVDLKTILREKSLTNSVRNFAKSEFSGENIAFLTEKNSGTFLILSTHISETVRPNR